jgi:hypothetical protein
MHKKEMAETKEKAENLAIRQEKLILEYKERVTEYETAIKSFQTKEAENDKRWQAKFLDVEAKRKETEEKLSRTEKEKNRIKESASQDSEVKLNNAMATIEKMIMEHKHEIELMKQDKENSLKEMKYIYENSNLMLESKLENANMEIKLLQSQKTSNDNRNLNEIQNNYLEEIQELNSQLDAFKKQSEEDVTLYKTQRDEAQKKAEDMEQKLEKVKFGVAEHEQLKKQVSEMQSYIARLQNSEKQFKKILTEEAGNMKKKKMLIKESINLPRSMTICNPEHRSSIKPAEQNNYEKVNKTDLRQLME